MVIRGATTLPPELLDEEDDELELLEEEELELELLEDDDEDELVDPELVPPADELELEDEELELEDEELELEEELLDEDEELEGVVTLTAEEQAEALPAAS